jgi:signal transduction histidine kinase
MSQRLYAAAFNADVLTHVPEDRPELAASQAITIRNLVLSSLAEMRTLLFELQPDTLVSTPLDALIRHLCQSMEETYDHPIEIESHPGQPVPPAPKLAMYRIVQESLGNALRHSQASRIAVSVGISDENVTIEITDDGVGFDPLAISSGHGLANTAERAREIGAELDIASSPGSGTAVSASWARPRSDEPLLDLTSPSMSESAGL